MIVSCSWGEGVPKQERKTAVYIIADMLSGDIKIGVSVNPENRCKQVSKLYAVGTVCVVSVCWFNSKEDAHKHERSFHRMYRSRRSDERGGREWFSLTSHEIEAFISAMKSYEAKRHEERGRYRNQGRGTKESVIS